MADYEKITINMSAVDLGKMDLLVQEGMYTNRTDFIRSAIRSQIDKHQMELQQAVTREAYVVGVLIFGKDNLEKMQAKGEKLRISVIGMLSLSSEIPVDLALEVIEYIKVRGIFNASDELRTALKGRIKV